MAIRQMGVLVAFSVATLLTGCGGGGSASSASTGGSGTGGSGSSSTVSGVATPESVSVVTARNVD